MKKIYLILLILFCTNNLFAQLYYASYGERDCYVEISGDSAHLEVFFLPPSSFYMKLHEEFLYAEKNDNSILFNGKEYQVLKKENDLFLVDKTKKKPRKVKLEISKLDLRDKNAHLEYIESQLDEIQDSLSGPFGSNEYRTGRIAGLINTDEYLYDDYTRLVNHIKDTMVINMLKSKDPETDFYYNILDSLSYVDSNLVYDLLANVNFNGFYGKKLIYKLALQKPEYLINYVDKNPENKDSLLLAIREHKNNREIHESIKKTPGKSEGRKEILKQKTKREAGNIATTGLFGVVIVAELSVLVLGIIWLL